MHRKLKAGGIGAIIALTIMLILFLVAFVTVVRLVNVQQNIASTTNQIVQRALSATGSAQFCADLYRVCSYTVNGFAINFTSPQPWLVIHCVPASYINKIVALQVQVKVYDTTTGKESTYMLLIPRKDFKFFSSPASIEVSPTPVNSCALVTNPSYVDNVVGYLNGTVIARMTGLSVDDLLGLTSKQVKVEVTYFLVSGVGWIRKSPCGAGASATAVVVASAPASGSFLPSVNIRPLKIFNTQYSGINYQYALTKPLTEPLYVGECFEVQLYFPAQWLQTFLNTTNTTATSIVLNIAQGTIEVYDQSNNDLTESGNVVLTQYGPTSNVTLLVGNLTGVAASYLLCYKKPVPKETIVSLYAKMPIIIGDKEFEVSMSIGTPLKLSPYSSPKSITLFQAPSNPTKMCPSPESVIGTSNAYVVALVWKNQNPAWRNAVPTSVLLDLRSLLEDAWPTIGQAINYAYLEGIFVGVWEGLVNPSLYPLNWTYTVLPPQGCNSPIDRESGVLTFLAEKPSGFSSTPTEGVICLYFGVALPGSGTTPEIGDGKWYKLADLNGYTCYAPSANQTFKMCYAPYKGPNAANITVPENPAYCSTGANIYEDLQPSVDSTYRTIKLKVYNPNTEALKNFQVRVQLPDALKSIPIKILDSQYNPVPFCYEMASGECTTDPTQGDGYIWVKVPYIPALGNSTLIIVQGNNTAVPGDKVFLLYDDFSGTSLNTTVWSVGDHYGQPVAYKVANGELLAYSNGFYIRSKESFDFSQGVAVEIGIKNNYPVCTSCTCWHYLIWPYGSNYGARFRGPCSGTSCLAPASDNLVSICGFYYYAYWSSVFWNVECTNCQGVSVPYVGYQHWFMFGYYIYPGYQKVIFERDDGSVYSYTAHITSYFYTHTSVEPIDIELADCTDRGNVYGQYPIELQWVRVRKWVPEMPKIYYIGQKFYQLVEYYNNGAVMPGLWNSYQNNICTNGGAPCLTIVSVYKPTWYLLLSGPYCANC
jgi:hypothetical protein